MRIDFKTRQVLPGLAISRRIWQNIKREPSFGGDIMKLTHRVPALLLAVLLAAVLVLPALAQEPAAEATILFTHDLHSHLLPAVDEAGKEYGGYARLKTVIDEQKKLHPDALLVDGGDFSMGTLFQTAYATAATELRIMGALGYDATTFGNHEYDYRAKGLARMLNSAVASGDPLPAIVAANYLPPVEGQEGYGADAAAARAALDNYGVTDYIILERGGLHYVIFGLLGVDSDACAPMSGMILQDMADTAQRVVDEAVAACVERYNAEPVVICLSHSGTSGDGKGEDYELAKAVDGIDVIVSGHTHSTTEEPIEVNDTLIVSCGEYSKNLGVLTLSVSSGEVRLADYEVIPVDDTVEEDPHIAALIEDYKAAVDEDYLSRFDMTFDHVLVNNPYPFASQSSLYAGQVESPLGNLISDAYKWAAEQAAGQPVDMALTAVGVIRESLPQGNITVSDVFNMASLGIGADEIPGYPLVSVYLTGEDLRNALEVDASVQPLMSAAQLFCSGVEYSFNTNRMIFNKVTEARLRRGDGTVEEIDDDKLYRVVTGLYCGQMLGAVEAQSFGILAVVPRDANGDPIAMDRLEDYIVHDSEGGEVKEWHAIATYLQAMGGKMDEAYSAPDGRKNVYASWNPVELLKNINKVTILVLAAALVVLIILILVIRAIYRRIYRRGGYRKTRGYHGYRGK